MLTIILSFSGILIIELAACVWVVKSNNRNVRKKQPGRVIQMEQRLRKTLDIKLSPSDEVIQQMDEALALTTSSFS